jgi:hypothetical protein
MEKMIDVKSTLEIIETKLAKKSDWKRHCRFGFKSKKAIGNDRDIWIKYLLKTSSY